VLDREQLLRALQLQDRVRRIRVGESAAMLGYIEFLMVEILYEQFVRSHGFDRPPRKDTRAHRARGWRLAYAPPECATRGRADRAHTSYAELQLGLL